MSSSSGSDSDSVSVSSSGDERGSDCPGTVGSCAATESLWSLPSLKTSARVSNHCGGRPGLCFFRPYTSNSRQGSHQGTRQLSSGGSVSGHLEGSRFSPQ